MGNSANSRRAFQFGDSCPPIPDIDDITIEIASLPDFCKFSQEISYISTDPTPPPDPAPPVEYKCPCPRADSPYVSFTSSADCCSWTLHLDYSAISMNLHSCSPSFDFCECKKNKDGIYRCQDYWCRRLKPGSMKLIGGADSTGCPSYILIYKPVTVSTPKCKLTIEGDDCNTEGCLWTYNPGEQAADKAGVKFTCEKELCIECQGTNRRCKTITYSFEFTPGEPVELDEVPGLEWYRPDIPEYEVKGMGSNGKPNTVTWGKDFTGMCAICQDEGDLGFVVKFMTLLDFCNADFKIDGYDEKNMLDYVCKNGTPWEDSRLTVNVVNCMDVAGLGGPGGNSGGSEGGSGSGGGS